MPVLRSSQVGDMYIQIVVETPRNLTRRQRELLEEFEKASSAENHPEFDRLLLPRPRLLRRADGPARSGRDALETARFRRDQFRFLKSLRRAAAHDRRHRAFRAGAGAA